ncbi:putative disease resistance protein RGA4 [Prunus yedoensis var. nudiflora]|uniref:Putative disease resistance protein RGA4 n=1 Tax=Prunus yedoensis var. nudiflora TaxID=2094558 RepID=A0A314ZBV0_PRUYE|nr:putative disease resistance protein RGA4 [Prunus yedoensis var. nudiflora]
MSEDDLPMKGERVPEFLRQLKKVWTILFPVPGHVGISSKSVLKACILRFKYLRVLDLSGSTFEVLPSSIGKLSRLRYLNLSKNPFIKKLPGSICNLLNLQTLLLSNCEQLSELPRDIGNLINLRTLVLTTNQMVLAGVIERLTSLRFLQTLGISDCEKLDLTTSGAGIRGLRSVSISSHLEALPHWLQDSANTLQSLRAKNCEDLKELPEWLQNFKLLQQLVIDYCPQLLALPQAMYHLGALRLLKIDGCSKLSERCNSKEGADWPKIAHVSKITLDGEIIASNDD